MTWYVNEAQNLMPHQIRSPLERVSLLEFECVVMCANLGWRRRGHLAADDEMLDTQRRVARLLAPELARVQGSTAADAW